MDIGAYFRKTARILYNLLFLVSMIGGLAGGAVSAFPTISSGGHASGSAGAVSFQQASTTITSVLCSIVTTVRAVVGVLALGMFLLGGVLFASAHFLPAAGNLKGNVQGWGVGIVMGGIIALLLYIIAPWLIGRIISLQGTTTGVSIGTIGSITCP